MTNEARQAEICDMADRVRALAENFASDLTVERGVSFEYALALAMAGVRRVAREGFNDPTA